MRGSTSKSSRADFAVLLSVSVLVLVRAVYREKRVGRRVVSQKRERFARVFREDDFHFLTMHLQSCFGYTRPAKCSRAGYKFREAIYSHFRDLGFTGNDKIAPEALEFRGSIALGPPMLEEYTSDHHALAGLRIRPVEERKADSLARMFFAPLHSSAQSKGRTDAHTGVLQNT